MKISASHYVEVAREAAVRAGINPDLFVKQIQQESGFNPHAVSPAGAIGIAQFMPETAAAKGINPHDPASSLNGAAALMADYLREYSKDYGKALAAYNYGPGNLNHAVSQGGVHWRNFLPTETATYIHNILEG